MIKKIVQKFIDKRAAKEEAKEKAWIEQYREWRKFNLKDPFSE